VWAGHTVQVVDRRGGGRELRSLRGNSGQKAELRNLAVQIGALRPHEAHPA
jgi:hypothetical protein